MTGHADGHLRFIDSNTVLVNELKGEFKYWRDEFLKMVKQAGLDFIEIPWFEHKDRNYKDTAIGGYVNYLEIGKVILFPIFEIKGNKDKEAIATIKKVFPDRIIEPINVNEIAKHGGLLNCVTWTIKT
jgi:agmatine deiminase